MDEIFNRLIKEKLTPNSLYVLHCIKNKVSVSKSLANSELEVYRLKSEGWINENLQLTSKSLIFMEELGSYFRKSKKKTSKDLMGDNNHYSARISSKLFNNISKIEQHKLVYKSLQGKMGNELHALSITTEGKK